MGPKARQYKRLAIEIIALIGERMKNDRSEDELDLSRRHWAEVRWEKSALRNRVSSTVKTRVSKLGGQLKEVLGTKVSRRRARSPIPMLPVASPQADP